MPTNKIDYYTQRNLEMEEQIERWKRYTYHMYLHGSSPLSRTTLAKMAIREYAAATERNIFDLNYGEMVYNIIEDHKFPYINNLNICSITRFRANGIL